MTTRTFGLLSAAMALMASSVWAAEEQYRVPPNYAQLIAQHVLGKPAVGGVKILNGTISQPIERFMGIVNGGMRPVVCAHVTYESRFGDFTVEHLVTFENGRIERSVNDAGAIWCAGVSERPFRELFKKG